MGNLHLHDTSMAQPHTTNWDGGISSEYTPLGGFEPKTTKNRLLETTFINVIDVVLSHFEIEWEKI